MRKRARLCLALLPLIPLAATAAELKDMLGSWRWREFAIEVRECQGGSLCAKVISGPKNVGMEIFASKLTSKDGDLVGQVTHPETKDVYNTRFQQKGRDTWRLDGCTSSRVCLTGEFVRAK